MNLQWRTRNAQGNSWVRLNRLNTDAATGGGVYVIWRAKDGKVVRVGKSEDLKARLAAHIGDQRIRAQGDGDDTLLVTWAVLDRSQWDRLKGIERYLHDRLSPILTERRPQDTAIRVNLPGE